MKALAAAVFAFVVKFGGLGLFVLGVLDSSYLFAPWGNDLLLVAMTLTHDKTAIVVLSSLGFGVADLMLPAAWALVRLVNRSRA